MTVFIFNLQSSYYKKFSSHYNAKLDQKDVNIFYANFFRVLSSVSGSANGRNLKCIERPITPHIQFVYFSFPLYCHLFTLLHFFLSLSPFSFHSWALMEAVWPDWTIFKGIGSKFSHTKVAQYFVQFLGLG